MRPSPTPPVLTLRLAALRPHYNQPYVMFCEGARLRGQPGGTNYNFSRDFTIAMTFSLRRQHHAGSPLQRHRVGDHRRPSTSRRTRSTSTTALYPELFDGSATKAPLFLGPTIPANLLRSHHRQTDHHAGRAIDDSSDPTLRRSSPRTVVNGLSHGFSRFRPLPSGGSALTSPRSRPPIRALRRPQINTSATLRQQLEVDFTISAAPSCRRHPRDAGNPLSPRQRRLPTATLTFNSTGSAHLLIGTATTTSGPIPLGGTFRLGNIRDVYIFGSAIDRDGITTNPGTIDIAGHGPAAHRRQHLRVLGRRIRPEWDRPEPDQPQRCRHLTNAGRRLPRCRSPGMSLRARRSSSTATRCRSRSSPAAPSLPPCTPVTPPALPCSTSTPASTSCRRSAIWTMTRQPYQVIDDMFGRIVTSNEPLLALYLPTASPRRRSTAPSSP